MGRLLLRPAARRGRRRRRSVEGRHAPGGAAAEDGGAQGLLLEENREGLDHRGLSDGRRDGRLGLDWKSAARRELQRTDFNTFRIRDSWQHAAGAHASHARGGDTRSGIRAALPARLAGLPNYSYRGNTTV